MAGTNWNDGVFIDEKKLLRSTKWFYVKGYFFSKHQFGRGGESIMICFAFTYGGAIEIVFVDNTVI